MALIAGGRAANQVSLEQEQILLWWCSFPRDITVLRVYKDLHLQDCNFSIFHWKLRFCLKLDK